MAETDSPTRITVYKNPPLGGDAGEDNPFAQFVTPTERRSAIALDPASRDLAIRTVYGEADGRDPAGRIAVADVIRNRLETGRWGKSARDVVLSKGQFEPWMRTDARGRMLSLQPEHPDYQSIGEYVDKVFSGELPDSTKGATHFYAPVAQRALGRNAPDWAQGQPLAFVGGHAFYSPDSAPVVRAPMAASSPGSATAGAPTTSPGAPATDNPFAKFVAGGQPTAPAQAPAPVNPAVPGQGEAVPLPRARPDTLGPDIGYAGAIGTGFQHGATFGFEDELKGVGGAIEKGAGLPKWTAAIPGLQTAVYFAKNAYRAYTGDPNPGTKQAFLDARNEARRQYKIAVSQYPTTTGLSEFAGGVAVPLPGAGLGAGVKGAAGVGKRILGGTLQGAAGGALSGAGEAEELSDVPAGIATGLGVGGGIGAGVSTALPVIGGIAKPFTRLAGAAIRPGKRAADIIAETEQKAASAEYKGDRIMPHEQTPGAAVIDRLGQPGADLARSAANISDVAKGNLKYDLRERAREQGARFTDYLRRTLHYPDLEKQAAAIEREGKELTGPAYKKAMDLGNHGVVSPEMLRLAAAPDVLKAVEKAMPELQGRGLLEGFRAPRSNPLVKNADGTVSLRQTPSGNTIVPDLRFWDAVKKKLGEEIGTAEKNPQAQARVEYLTRLKNEIVAEADHLVPEYKTARSIAENFFGQRNALEAGKSFVTANHNMAEATTAFKSMSATQQQLFRDGFGAKLIHDIKNMPDQNNIWNKINQHENARDKIAMVLGPQRAKEIELIGRLEGLMQRSHEAVSGNSTSVDQLLKSSMATAMGTGLSAGYFGSGGDLSITGIATAGAGLAKKKVDVRVANKVAEMLLSRDQSTIDRAVKIASRNEGMMDVMRRALTLATKSGSSMAARSEVQSQNRGP